MCSQLESKGLRGYLYSVVRAADIMGYLRRGRLSETVINLYVHVMVRELQLIMIYKKNFLIRFIVHLF